MTRQVTLTVNDVPIKLGDAFVHDYLDHVISGILTSLKGTGEIDKLRLFIDNEGQVDIELNGAQVPLKPFPNEIIRSTVMGAITTLKGVGGVERLEITIFR